MDIFLTNEEKRAVQRMYKHWLDYLKPDEFADKLYMLDLMRLREKQKLDAKQTIYSKNEFLFDVALQRITYDHMTKVRQVLVDTEQQELARMLPLRPGDHFWDSYDQIVRRQEQEERQRMQNLRRPASPMDTTDHFHHHHESMPEPDLKSQPDPPPTAMSNPDASTVPAAQSEQAQRPDPLPAYKIKENNNATGKGYCLIIANYTNHLLGYKEDVKKLTKFFRDVLGYTVRTETNILRAKMLNVLNETQNELIIEENNFDRLFVFVLSHGEKEGIQTCRADGTSDEWLDGNKQHVKPEEVISRFTHDSLPSLKEFPKAFFFQICRGKGYAKAASGVTDELVDEDEVEGELAQPAAMPARIAIGADTLVCYASPEGKYSWVDPKKGSWLIEVTLQVFEDHYQSEHLVDMVTQINKDLTTKTQQAQVGDEIKVVYQIPCIQHNLTRKLFLKTTGVLE